jgi:D-arabinose 1-dehydrogenase-like Zn-dependent alcohol dehydrogenase
MKAFVVGRYGSEAGVRMREVPEPDVGEHDVLVEVRAASVNPLDAKIRDGEFKLILPYRVPFVLGHDMAGQVVRVGSAVRSFAPGDAVYARPRKDRIGTFAELIAVHEDDLALKPSTLTMVEAAALPLVALTAWQALVERANLRPGQKVLVHAGSVVWARSRSNSPSTSGHTSRRRRARQTSSGSRIWALTLSSTIGGTTSRPSCAITTWSWTAWAERRSRSPSAC